jgi:hypothetical protein
VRSVHCGANELSPFWVNTSVGGLSLATLTPTTRPGRVGGEEKNSQDTREILEKGVLRIEPRTPTRRPDTDEQEPSTIDLVIAAPEITDRVSEAVIADDLTIGSETLAWEIHTDRDP